MEHRVLVPADVGRHGEPGPGPLGVPGPIVELGGRIAKEVPRRVEERVRHVGFPPAGGTALRALHEIPLFVPRERAHAGGVGTEVLDERQHDGKVVLRHPHRAAPVAVDDRDRRSPVALARDAPVVKAVLDLRRREPPFPQPGHDAPLRIAARQPVELPRVHHGAVLGDARERLVGLHDSAHGEVERRRELEVALVVGRHRHDGARAVLHDHVVGDPDGDRFPGRWIAGVGAEKHPALGLLAHLARHEVPRQHLAPVGVDLVAPLVGRERVHEGVLGREHDVSGAEHRVRPGGEDG